MSNAPDLVTSEAVKTIRSVAEEWRDGHGPHIDLMVLSRMAGIVQSACDVVSEADTRCEVTTNAPDLVSAAHDVLTVHPDLAECESMARLRSALAAHESREAERKKLLRECLAVVHVVSQFGIYEHSALLSRLDAALGAKETP